MEYDYIPMAYSGQCHGCWCTGNAYKGTLAPEAGISAVKCNCIPQNTVACNYLSLSEIPASGTKFLIWYLHNYPRYFPTWLVFQKQIKISWWFFYSEIPSRLCNVTLKVMFFEAFKDIEFQNLNHAHKLISFDTHILVFVYGMALRKVHLLLLSWHSISL